MESADDYRRNGDECLRAAKITLRPEVRDVLLDMAGKWHTLADQVESNERLRQSMRQAKTRREDDTSE